MLRRCQPEGGAQANARWLAAFQRGENPRLELRYGPAPELGALRSRLEATAAALHGGVVEALYAERAAELELEARLAEAVGTPAFGSLARQRHAVRGSPEWQAARTLALGWAKELITGDDEPRHESGDRRRPESLVSVLLRELGALRLPVRVEVVPSLGSRAATGTGVIFVRAGVRLSEQQGQRIAAHEIHGHALPRELGRSQALGLFRVGSARSSDDEEGRAVLLEERLGFLDPPRRAELGFRHLGALAVSEGASDVECVRLLVGRGCPLPAALDVYARAARGGGLCRELEYLPALLRVKEAFAVEPNLERWLEHGRLSLNAARALRAQGIAPRSTSHSKVATTGT